MKSAWPVNLSASLRQEKRVTEQVAACGRDRQRVTRLPPARRSLLDRGGVDDPSCDGHSNPFLFCRAYESEGIELPVDRRPWHMGQGFLDEWLASAVVRANTVAVRLREINCDHLSAPAIHRGSHRAFARTADFHVEDER